MTYSSGGSSGASDGTPSHSSGGVSFDGGASSSVATFGPASQMHAFDMFDAPENITEEMIENVSVFDGDYGESGDTDGIKEYFQRLAKIIEVGFFGVYHKLSQNTTHSHLLALFVLFDFLQLAAFGFRAPFSWGSSGDALSSVMVAIQLPVDKFGASLTFALSLITSVVLLAGAFFLVRFAGKSYHRSRLIGFDKTTIVMALYFLVIVGVTVIYIPAVNILLSSFNCLNGNRYDCGSWQHIVTLLLGLPALAAYLCVSLLVQSLMFKPNRAAKLVGRTHARVDVVMLLAKTLLLVIWTFFSEFPYFLSITFILVATMYAVLQTYFVVFFEARVNYWKGGAVFGILWTSICTLLTLQDENPSPETLWLGIYLCGLPISFAIGVALTHLRLRSANAVKHLRMEEITNVDVASMTMRTVFEVEMATRFLVSAKFEALIETEYEVARAAAADAKSTFGGSNNSNRAGDGGLAGADAYEPGKPINVLLLPMSSRVRAAVSLAQQIFAEGLRRFPESGYLHSVYGYFVMHYFDDTGGFLGQHDLAKLKRPYLDTRYSIYAASLARLKASGRVDAISVLTYEKYLMQARRFHVLSLLNLRLFWRYVRARKYGEDDMVEMAGKVSDSSRHAGLYYMLLLRKFPESDDVWEHFAHYLEFVKLDAAGAKKAKKIRHAIRSDNRARNVSNEAGGKAIVTIDTSGIVLSVNGYPRQLLGYSEEELIGRNIKMIMPEPHRSQHDGYLARYLTTRRATVLGNTRRMQALRKDGMSQDINLSVSPMILDGNEVYVGVLHGIKVTTAVINCMSGGEIISCTSGALRMFGYKRANSLRGKLIDTLVDVADLTGFYASHGEAMVLIDAHYRDGSSMSVNMQLSMVETANIHNEAQDMPQSAASIAVFKLSFTAVDSEYGTLLIDGAGHVVDADYHALQLFDFKLQRLQDQPLSSLLACPVSDIYDDYFASLLISEDSSAHTPFGRRASGGGDGGVDGGSVSTTTADAETHVLTLGVSRRRAIFPMSLQLTPMRHDGERHLSVRVRKIEEDRLIGRLHFDRDTRIFRVNKLAKAVAQPPGTAANLYMSDLFPNDTAAFDAVVRQMAVGEQRSMVMDMRTYNEDIVRVAVRIVSHVHSQYVLEFVPLTGVMELELIVDEHMVMCDVMPRLGLILGRVDGSLEGTKIESIVDAGCFAELDLALKACIGERGVDARAGTFTTTSVSTTSVPVSLLHETGTPLSCEMRVSMNGGGGADIRVRFVNESNSLVDEAQITASSRHKSRTDTIATRVGQRWDDTGSGSENSGNLYGSSSTGGGTADRVNIPMAQASRLAQRDFKRSNKKLNAYDSRESSRLKRNLKCLGALIVLLFIPTFVYSMVALDQQVRLSDKIAISGMREDAMSQLLLLLRRIGADTDSIVAADEGDDHDDARRFVDSRTGTSSKSMWTAAGSGASGWNDDVRGIAGTAHIAN